MAFSRGLGYDSEIMDETLQIAKSAAESEFLGRNHVIAIAISTAPVLQLVFFLDGASRETQRTIVRWAGRQGVTVDFRVVGQFVPTVYLSASK